LSLFDPSTNKARLFHQFQITNMGGTGLIGVTLDPRFMKNNWIYVYYAPGGLTEDSLHFNLSRFTIKNDKSIDPKSEKVLLQVPVQKNSGSHHGGSLAWDKQGWRGTNKEIYFFLPAMEQRLFLQMDMLPSTRGPEKNTTAWMRSAAPQTRTTSKEKY
jgi:hypothetical protein